MRRPVISIVVFSLGFGATATRALGVAPENVLQGESGVAATSGRAVPDRDPSRRLPAQQGATKAIPDSVFGPDSALPEARPAQSKGSSVESSTRNPLTQPGCDICLEGSGSVHWAGSTGSYHMDEIGNFRASGTSGTLDLRIALSSSTPVFGQNITYYTFSDVQSFSPLAAGYHYSPVDSGTVNFYPSSIPAGQYWIFLFLREYQGSGTWTYTDFALMSNMASCNGVSCAVVGPCVEDAYTMCLGGGRYKVTSRWQNQYVGDTVTTPMLKTDLTDVVGAFWKDADAYQFFVSVNPATAALNGHTWVAMNTFSGVEFWIDVTDTVSGQFREYHNPPENKTLVEDRTFFVFP